MLIEHSVYNRRQNDQYYGARHFRYASVGGCSDVQADEGRNIRRTYSDGAKVRFDLFMILTLFVLIIIMNYNRDNNLLTSSQTLTITPYYLHNDL